MYTTPVLKEIPRLLSWEDREPFSITYGCFDRTYWGWKFTDFPGARFQEGVYALAHLYTTPFENNVYYQQARVLEWARAGMRYWARLQYADGSFDEAYPFEHSLAAVAFTGFYVGEAFLKLENSLPAEDISVLRGVFARAGGWLCKNDEHHGLLSNHLAAAAAALEVMYRICGESRFQKRSQHFLQRIYDHQSPEGWYEEYGGADIGYQTHGTFYLARLWQMTQNTTLLSSLEKSLDFLQYFFHPNRTLGGEYGSRNTEFYFPAGFEILADTLPAAAKIAAFMRPAVADQQTAGLAAMDAYNFLPLMNNYLFAAQAEKPLLPSPMPCEQVGESYFADAGLFVKTTPAYYAVLGLSKGVLKVYQDGKLSVSDCGYWARAGSKTLTSQSFTRQWQREKTNFRLTLPFVQVNQRVQKTWQFILFRLFSLTFGRWPTAAYRVKNLLVFVLVRRRREFPLRLTRQIRFEEKQVVVEDSLELMKPVTHLYHESKFASIHMGSSRYFQPQELESVLPERVNLALNQEQKISFQHRYPQGGE